MVAAVGTVRVGPAPYAEKDGGFKEVPLEKLVTEQAPEQDLEKCTLFWKMVMEAAR